MPAYVWALALPVAWLLRRTIAGRFTVRRRITYAAKIAGLAVCSIAFLVSVALPVTVPVFHVLSPTGRYGIGRDVPQGRHDPAQAIRPTVAS